MSNYRIDMSDGIAVALNAFYKVIFEHAPKWWDEKKVRLSKIDEEEAEWSKGRLGEGYFKIKKVRFTVKDIRGESEYYDIMTVVLRQLYFEKGSEPYWQVSFVHYYDSMLNSKASSSQSLFIMFSE